MEKNSLKERKALSERAKEHVKEAESLYENEIKEASEKALICSSFSEEKENVKGKAKITVENITPAEAVQKYVKKSKSAVLDEASYSVPARGFLRGISCDESGLCSASFLYNVLLGEKEYYEWNLENLNRDLYTNRALYIPEVLFSKTEEDFLEKKGVLCDVIVCSPPDVEKAKREEVVSESENKAVLASRCKFVLDTAREQDVKTLILSAFGCSSGQKAEETALAFKKALEEGASFKKVIFAVKKPEDFEVFKSVFSDS